MDAVCHIPVSVGELFDKFTILEIKTERLNSISDIQTVQTEISFLKPILDTYLHKLDRGMYERLKSVNEALWDIEDAIRDKERKKEFDEEFIQLARNVYITNDERSRIKKNINLMSGSKIVEVKGYQAY